MSRMPAEFALKPTVNVPTAVLAAPAPSASVSVATAPLTVTDASDPAEGTLASAHEDTPAEYGASVSSNVATTWSTLPLALMSFICNDTSTGGITMLIVAAANVDAESMTKMLCVGGGSGHGHRDGHRDAAGDDRRRPCESGVGCGVEAKRERLAEREARDRAPTTAGSEVIGAVEDRVNDAVETVIAAPLALSTPDQPPWRGPNHHR